jgi:hypothetical protein
VAVPPNISMRLQMMSPHDLGDRVPHSQRVSSRRVTRDVDVVVR